MKGKPLKGIYRKHCHGGRWDDVEGKSKNGWHASRGRDPKVNFELQEQVGKMQDQKITVLRPNIENMSRRQMKENS